MQIIRCSNALPAGRSFVYQEEEVKLKLDVKSVVIHLSAGVSECLDI